MSNHKDEIVVKMREKFFCKDQKQEDYEKNEANVFFVNLSIGNYGIEEVFSAGLLLLFGMKKDEFSWLDKDDYGKPRNSLEVLFNKALEEGYETEIENAVLEMYGKGNPSCLFLFQILKESKMESILFLEKILKEMKKKTKSSKQGDIKKEFIKNYQVDIETLINESQAQLSLFPQPSKTPVKF